MTDITATENQLGPLLLSLSAAPTDEIAFLDQAFRAIAELESWESLGIARCDAGLWVIPSGGAASAPEELLADSLDRESAVSSDGWFAVPLDPASGTNELLTGQFKDADTTRLVTAASMLTTALGIVRERQRINSRVGRLEAILQIAAQWNQTHQMKELLQNMAETSTRLLSAERASIFLWDQQSKTLVGRPALGVEGGELRIPDDAGVVGQVVQTGTPRRVGVRGGQQEIFRTVDKKLRFDTRSLVCVPLRSQSGEVLGAFELINKTVGDFTAEDEDALVELAEHASTALENMQQRAQLLRVRAHLIDEAAEGTRLLGECAAIEDLRSTIERVADTELAVLVLGENGTGKEVIARRIHYLSRRRNEPLVAVNCAALPESLLESELFGHEQGAFTDAREARAGKFELASGGTLFLDEIGDMSLGGQAKLLRVLEEKIVVRVGGSTNIHIDARVMAATNQDLAQKVRDKKFREDLYYRLNVVSLEIPPLRYRDDDVLLLAEHFLTDFSAKAGRKLLKLTAAAKRRLRAHRWPGNVRELRNLMERLAYLAADTKIDADEIAFILSPRDGSETVFSLDRTLADATKDFQVQYIRKQVDRSGKNMTDAAARLGLHRSNLYRKMRQLGIESPEEPDGH
jgi:transcriptional regulator with GAF, ATPase, and Fis domain